MKAFASLLLLAAVSLSAAAPWPAVRLYGEDYVNLAVVAERLGLKAAPDTTGQKLLLKDGPAVRFAFEDTQRDFYLDGARIHMSRPVVADKGSLWVTRIDVEKTIAPLFRPKDRAARLPRARPRTIMLDPGHGGTDPGTENRKLGLSEKVFALDVALRLKKLLEADGHRVLLTREKDERFSNNPRVDLPMRAAVANKAGADLFISIHFNHAPESITGVETYVFTPQFMLSTSDSKPDENTPQAFPANRQDDANVLLGYQMHRAMVAGLRTPDRGFKRARWAVLRDLACPGVLVEAAYLSNDEEAKRVDTAGFRQQIAGAIAQGVRNYAEALRGASVPTGS